MLKKKSIKIINYKIQSIQMHSFSAMNIELIYFCFLWCDERCTHLGNMKWEIKNGYMRYYVMCNSKLHKDVSHGPTIFQIV